MRVMCTVCSALAVRCLHVLSVCSLLASMKSSCRAFEWSLIGCPCSGMGVGGSEMGDASDLLDSFRIAGCLFSTQCHVMSLCRIDSLASHTKRANTIQKEVKLASQNRHDSIVKVKYQN